MPDAPPQPPPLDKQEILASDISHFEAWWFSVDCRHCRMIREFLPGQLLNAARRPGTVAEVLARLRCSRCGEPPRGVTMFSHHSGTAQGPVREVTLLGARTGAGDEGGSAFRPQRCLELLEHVGRTFGRRRLSRIGLPSRAFP